MNVINERYMKGRCGFVASDPEVPMCVAAATYGFMESPAACRRPRTPSAPIGTVSGRGGRHPRTYSGQRPCKVNYVTIFPQVRGIITGESVNTVKPSAQPTLVRTQHLPLCFRRSEPVSLDDGTGFCVPLRAVREP